MSASLVGSEMCIRDRSPDPGALQAVRRVAMLFQHRLRDVRAPRGWRRPHPRLRRRRILGITRDDLRRSAVRTLGPGRHAQGAAR
eukprot:636171-Alexandrium_andersonii.AAC.1